METRTVRLNFDLSFVYGPRTWRVPMVFAMLFSAVGELDSESVTLSTYYPAPSGVYTNMITTGNTFLARDGGAATRVGLGTTVPSQKLSVEGSANVTGRLAVGSAIGVAPTQAVDVNGSVRVVRSGCTPSTASNGACAGNAYITWSPGVYIEGTWSSAPDTIVMTSFLNPPNPVLRTPTYYCCPDT